MLIAAARQDAGLTQRELADRIGASLWDVDRIERGEGDAAPHLAAIAAATGSSVERLDTLPRRALEGANGTRTVVEEPEAGEGSAPRAMWVRNVILGSIVLLVVVRFLAEDLGVVPTATKLVDVPIFFALLLLAAIASRGGSPTTRGVRYGVPALLFFAVATVSVVVNSRRIEIAPTLLFLYGFLSPIAVFYAVRQIWPTGQALALSRVLVGLACVQFVAVLFIDLPEYLDTKDPDLVSGTFGENAYQLVFFLLMSAALVVGILTTERRRLVARVAPVFFACVIGTLLLAQYRAILLTAALTMVLIAAVVGLVRARGAIAGVMVAATFAVGISVIPSVLPELKLEDTVETLTGNPGSYVSQRLEAGGDVPNLYTEMPHTIAVGSGPGTFSSRAWETFSEGSGKSSASLGVALPFAGAQGYRTDVSDKYTIPRLKNQEVVEGSNALTTPLSSYFALLAEVGIVGFVLMVALYGRALFDSLRMTFKALSRAPDGDPLPGLLLASAAGFFVIIQMGILENWWEVTRLTFILWILFAVATKEYEARYETPAR